MIDVASGERLNVLIILVISLAVYAFVPWIPRLLEKNLETVLAQTSGEQYQWI
jgi:predicted HAD superfamily phosphohydrolase YqeG